MNDATDTKEFKSKFPRNTFNVSGYNKSNRYMIKAFFVVVDINSGYTLLDDKGEDLTFGCNTNAIEYIREYVFKNPGCQDHQFTLEQVYIADYVSEE